jgi:hypothetical protein
VDSYVDEWVLGIENFTKTVQVVYEAVQRRDFDAVDELVPAEVPYPVSDSIAMRIDAWLFRNPGGLA